MRRAFRDFLLLTGTSVGGGPWTGSGAISDDGVWTWFVDPRAIYHNRKLYVGFVSQGGSPSVAQYDLDNDTLRTRTLKYGLEVDDHDNPSLIVLADGRIRAFYCRHAVNGDPLYSRVTTNPEDISSWGTEQTITQNLVGTEGYSYPKPHRLSAESDRIYLFFRSASFEHGCIFSDDDGATWSAAVAMFSNGTERPYFQAQGNGVDTIHFTCTDGHPRDVDNNLYHFYYQGDNLYKSDGTLIGPLADGAGPGDVTKIYDHATSGKAWGWDLMIDSDGHPRVVYAAFVSDSDHRYRYARWTGTEWQDAEICAAGADIHAGLIGGAGDGEPNYSGGVAIDPATPSQVYASLQVGAAEWDISRWRSADDGLTWSKSSQVTLGTGRKNVRPYVPRGLPADAPRLLWVQGASATDGGYTSYQDWRTRLRAGPALPLAAETAGEDIGLDNFVGTNGTSLLNHSPDVGGGWESHPTHTGQVQIQGNRAAPVNTTAFMMVMEALLNEGVDEYAVECTLRVITATGLGGVCGWLHPTVFDGYHVRYNFSGGVWQLFAAVNAVSTQVGSNFSEALSAGNTRTLRAEFREGSQRIFIQGVERITGSDTSVPKLGLPAIRGAGGSPTTGIHIEDFKVEAL